MPKKTATFTPTICKGYKVNASIQQKTEDRKVIREDIINILKEEDRTKAEITVILHRMIAIILTILTLLIDSLAILLDFNFIFDIFFM